MTNHDRDWQGGEMRIEYKKSTGSPFGQFIVFAENELERIILHNFLMADKNTWKFWLHGGTYSCDLDDYTSFNFGYVKRTS